MRKIISGSWAAGHTDVALLALRVATGAVFFMHGWQKLQGGVEGVTGFLTSLGFPIPGILAVVLIATEVLGGAALILGAWTRLAAKLTGIVALVAFLAVHITRGFFVNTGGYEFVMVLLAGCIAIFILGPGRWSVDRKLGL